MSSQLTLAIEPRLELTWSVPGDRWRSGFKLLVFHSTTGFSPEEYPEDLNRHGRLIIETTADGSHDERPAEGTQFYSFVLHKKGWLGLSEHMTLVRFSETIPSAKIAIGRIKDGIELQSMLRQSKLNQIENGTSVRDAKVRRIESRRRLERARGIGDEKPNRGKKLVAEKKAEVEAMLEAEHAKNEMLAALDKDPKFRKLDRTTQKRIRQAVREKFDLGEISADYDLRG